MVEVIAVVVVVLNNNHTIQCVRSISNVMEMSYYNVIDQYSIGLIGNNNNETVE